MALLHCKLVIYLGLKHFYVSLIDLFEKINVILVITVLGQVSMIANDMLFLKN